MEAVCSGIIEQFDSIIPGMYDEGDREKGYIVSKDREGAESRFPIMSISIGVVTNEDNRIDHPGEISTMGAELKKQAKAVEGSNFIVG